MTRTTSTLAVAAIGLAVTLGGALAGVSAAPTLLRLTLILNAKGGHALRMSDPMPADACRAAMHAIWEAPFPTVATSETGQPLPAVDAYCAPSLPAVVPVAF